MSRTEDQKIAMEPIKAVLCGKEVEIPLLKIGKSRVWKQAWSEAIFGSKGYSAMIAKMDKVKTQQVSPEELQQTLGEGFHTLLVGQPETVIKLVTDYVIASGCEITKEEIEEKATEAEIALLWDQINEVAFPLVTSLATAMVPKTKTEKK